jgi:hypothetical protein
MPYGERTCYILGRLAIDPLEELEEADSTFMTTDFSGAAGCSQKWGLPMRSILLRLLYTQTCGGATEGLSMPSVCTLEGETDKG